MSGKLIRAFRLVVEADESTAAIGREADLETTRVFDVFLVAFVS